MLHSLPSQSWGEHFSSDIQHQAITALESGQMIFFPQLKFNLMAEEQQFLTPDYADPKAKNISYHPIQRRLWGVRGLIDEQHIQLKNLLDRFSSHALVLIQKLLPRYTEHLITARTSFRPVQISGRKTSYKKDDKRLHVDAFPSAPNQGKRILRVFTNINPLDEDRVWRVGEPFTKVAQQFLPNIAKPFPIKASLLSMLKITKSYRTLYDHYMLQMHDRMKQDEIYQKNADQQEIRFPAGSTWIVQTDQVSHAAMQGQYVLEQTFYLPVHAMQDQSFAPLRVLEKMLGEKLV